MIPADLSRHTGYGQTNQGESLVLCGEEEETGRLNQKEISWKSVKSSQNQGRRLENPAGI